MDYRTHIYAYSAYSKLYIFVMNKPLTSDSATWLGLGFDSDSELTRSTGELEWKDIKRIAWNTFRTVFP